MMGGHLGSIIKETDCGLFWLHHHHSQPDILGRHLSIVSALLHDPGQDPSRCGPRCSLLLVIATVPTIDYTPIFSISVIKYFFISAYLLEFIYYISELRRYEYTIKFLALIKVIFSTEKTKKMLFARRRVFLYHASRIAFYRVVRCRFNMFLLNRVPILRYMGGSILF